MRYYITPEEAERDIINYLASQDEEFFDERKMSREEFLGNSTMMQAIAAEHLRCANRYGCERDWSCADACNNAPDLMD